MKIAIRGGHTKASTGSIGILNELNEDRKVTQSVIKYLKMLGQDVKDVTPLENVKYPQELNFGINTANKWKSDLFVSIHFNKAYTKYNGSLGSEVLVYNKNDYAQRILNELSKLGFKNRGQKIRHDLGELTKTKMTALIVEVCFVEATKDAELYKKLGYDKIGKAIAEAIIGKKINTSNSNSIYRVVVDNKNFGAYGVTENILNTVKEQLKKSPKEIKIQKV